MLSFLMKPRSQASYQRHEADFKGPVTRPFYKTRLQDVVRTTGSFQGVTHPRIAAGEMSTCRS